MTDYYCTLTAVGAAKLAQAGLLGQPLKITHIGVGDGNPDSIEPTPSSVLVSEKYRHAVNTVYSPVSDKSVVIVEMPVPNTEGNWEVNEVGIFDSVGDLIAIASYPRTWKPKIFNGVGRVLLIRVMIDVGSVENVTLQIDPSMVMASRDYVDTVATGMIRYYESPPAQNIGSMIYVWPLGLMRWFGEWYRSVDCGQIRLIGRATPEPGTIKANGATLDKAAAPGLWSWAQEAGVVVPLASWLPGTPFYAEVSATKFKVPELRAEHLRAWDDGRGTDAGRAFGSWQDSENKSHAHTAASGSAGAHAHTATSGSAGAHAHTATSGSAGAHAHTATSGSSGAHAHTASTGSAGAHTHTVKEGSVATGGADETLASGDDMTNTVLTYSTTNSAGAHTHTVTVDAAAAHTHTVTVDAAAAHTHTVTVDQAIAHSHTVTVDQVAAHGHAITVDTAGGAESRGRNVALLAVIHL